LELLLGTDFKDVKYNIAGAEKFTDIQKGSSDMHFIADV
jgi:hypothetical protein